MSNYCNCCSNDVQWCMDHLNWIIPSNISLDDIDWKEEAVDCKETWKLDDLTIDDLAYLLRQTNEYIR